MAMRWRQGGSSPVTARDASRTQCPSRREHTRSDARSRRRTRAKIATSSSFGRASIPHPGAVWKPHIGGRAPHLAPPPAHVSPRPARQTETCAVWARRPFFFCLPARACLPAPACPRLPARACPPELARPSLPSLPPTRRLLLARFILAGTHPWPASSFRPAASPNPRRNPHTSQHALPATSSTPRICHTHGAPRGASALLPATRSTPRICHTHGAPRGASALLQACRGAESQPPAGATESRSSAPGDPMGG
jgi:hypothetical protein